ncbi:MAG: hypothetical protein U1E52_09385 [Geminicoccaceae bacterium]
MPWIETSVLKETWDVDRRLRELALSRGSLLVVRDVALNEAANATPNHCANAAGTFSYQHGTWALRDQFAGLRWTVDRADGVEAIFNKDLNIRIAFQNVDRACDDEIAPAPRSEKGAGAERLCQGNGLFGQLPRFAPVPFDKCATFYLMTASDGACELSRPVITNGAFTAYVERIYLSDGSDFTDRKPLPLDSDDAATDFDPQVTRKA